VGSKRWQSAQSTLPRRLKDVAAFSALIGELLQRSYSEAGIHAIPGENILRVWQEVSDYASGFNRRQV
jgi:membrane dipeptidase